MPDNRPRGDIQIPLGYRGNAFSPPTSAHKPQSPPTKPVANADRPKISETAFEKIRELPAPPPDIPQEPDVTEVSEPIDRCDLCEKNELAPKKSGLGSILSPDGSLDAEELLILALALIVFQGGKENELALLLLALLFIK